MYEGGRPSGLLGFMGSEVLDELALEGGDSELVLPGGGVVVVFWAATLLEDRRLEPLTRFLKRAFMDDMKEEEGSRARREGGREGKKSERGAGAGAGVSWQAGRGGAGCWLLLLLLRLSDVHS